VLRTGHQLIHEHAYILTCICLNLKHALELIFSLFCAFCRWILNVNCNGSRNILEGLRRALENEDQKQHNIGQLTNVVTEIKFLLKAVYELLFYNYDHDKM